MSPRKSLAMVLTAPRKLEARDLPIPEPADDTALLRVEACGICGSDAEQYEGVLRTPTPVVPGHEPLGIIERIGDAAARRWGVDVGDRVAVETLLACRSCPPCLSGNYQLCRTRRIYSYVQKEKRPAMLFLRTFELRGYIHLHGKHEVQGPLTREGELYIPVTEATLVSTLNPRVRVTASTVMLRERALDGFYIAEEGFLKDDEA